VQLCGGHASQPFAAMEHITYMTGTHHIHDWDTPQTYEMSELQPDSFLVLMRHPTCTSADDDEGCAWTTGDSGPEC
jgi:hypothetical protein